MSTIGQTKAAEMAYKKVQALKAQFYRRDLNPADDYKGTLMQRPKQRRQDVMKNTKGENVEQLMKIAEITSSIEQGFKGNK